MARRGFLGRIVDRVREFIAPPSPPPREREPGPEAPRERERRGDPYRRAWRDQGGKGSYRKNREVFDKMMDAVHEDDENEREELWESFVRNIVNGKNRPRRQSTDNPFWRDSGIDPSNFRWKDWREAMGYTGKRRSRTP